MKKTRMRRFRVILIVGAAVFGFKLVVSSLLVRLSKDVVPIEEILAAVTQEHLLDIKKLILTFDAQQSEKPDLLSEDFWLTLKDWTLAAYEEDGSNEKVLEAALFRENGVPVDRFDNEMRLREVDGRIVLESAGQNGRWGDVDDLLVIISEN